MTTSVSDERRREEIVERTLMGLEEDIEDLRDELIDDLTAFEGKISRLEGRIPRWLELPSGSIKAVFRFADDTVEPSAMLGPRAVAMGAGRLEAFIHQWLGVDGQPVSVQLDRDEREDLAGDYAALREYFARLRHDAEQTHDDAEGTLNEWLDGVLSQLDMRRETDLDAVEQLVHEGEIGKGSSARQEMADLWEEQRLKADELRTAWRPIEEHLNTGLEKTMDAIDELEQLVDRACNGLVGANSELRESLEYDAPSEDASKAEASVDAADSVTEPMSSPESSPESSPVVDEASETEVDAAGDDHRDDGAGGEEALAEADAAEDTNGASLAPPDPGQAELPDGDDALRVDDHVSDTIPDVDGAGGIVPPDEPEKPELGSLESSSVNDYSEPSPDQRATQPGPMAKASDSQVGPEDASAPVESASGPTEPGRPGSDDQTPPEPTPDDSPTAATRPRAATAPAVDQPGPGGAEAGASDEAEAVSGQCFRIRDGYRRVGFLEIVVGAAIPLIFLVVVGVIAAMDSFGQRGFDPFERWGWMPAALVVSAAWSMLVPAALRWRPKWLGWKPRIVRMDDVREEREVEIGDDGIRLGEDAWRWGQLRGGELCRWDSPPDDMQGWLILVESPRQGVLEFASPEQDRDTWQRSTYELVDAPYEAWQLDRRLFRELRDRIIGD